MSICGAVKHETTLSHHIYQTGMSFVWKSPHPHYLRYRIYPASADVLSDDHTSMSRSSVGVRGVHYRAHNDAWKQHEYKQRKKATVAVTMAAYVATTILQ